MKGRLSTEVAFMLLIQQTQDQISMLPKFSWVNLQNTRCWAHLGKKGQAYLGTGFESHRGMTSIVQHVRQESLSLRKIKKNQFLKRQKEVKEKRFPVKQVSQDRLRFGSFLYQLTTEAEALYYLHSFWHWGCKERKGERESVTKNCDNRCDKKTSFQDFRGTDSLNIKFKFSKDQIFGQLSDLFDQKKQHFGRLGRASLEHKQVVAGVH